MLLRETCTGVRRQSMVLAGSRGWPPDLRNDAIRRKPKTSWTLRARS